jgi:hypothetical protein
MMDGMDDLYFYWALLYFMLMYDTGKGVWFIDMFAGVTYVVSPRQLYLRNDDNPNNSLVAVSL